ncbi:MAG: SMP-30/gluconolactonase/LRE family protein [Gemmataceae bacterium]
MKRLMLLVWTILLAGMANAGEVSTFAGTGTKGFAGDGGLANKAQIDNPFGVIRGPDGNIWFCEYTGQRVRKVSKDGKITNIAGNGKKGYSGDGGPAVDATFNLPHEIRFDKKGDLYIVDMVNNAVRKVDMKTGIISTIAGTGKPGYSGDGGQANKAQLKSPHSIQFDQAGDLYICDIGNHVIRKIDMKTGIISTFAGTGKPGVTPDNSPLDGTPINGPRSLDLDSQGNLWLATREGNQVFRIDPKQRKIYHIAGTGKAGFTGHGGPAKQANLSGPKGIAVGPDGNIYLADCESHSIRMIDMKKGTIELLVGDGKKGDGPDGDPLKCQLARPHGIFVDSDGTIFIGDSENHRVRRVK